jgi:hypothetical protein
MYDPMVGRFLSPDPYVADGTYSQDFNRYSYARNNPMIYTDPDGEFIHLIIGAAIGGIMNWATHGFQFNAKGLGYFGVGALAGALGAGVGAGISSAMAGGSFGAGFVGSSAAMTATSSFVSGATIGGGAGFSSGFTTGLGNGLLGGQNFGQALGQGFMDGFIAGGTASLLGGIGGGLDAIGDKRNFWTGNDQGMGRSLFAFNNSDKAATHYRTRRGYEFIDGIERKGSQWVDTYTDRVHWGYGDSNTVSNGAISRRDNYLLPGEELNLSLNKTRGRASVQFRGSIPEGGQIQVLHNGKIVQTFSQGSMTYGSFIPANVNSVTVRFLYTAPTEMTGLTAFSPFRTMIKVFLPF